MARITEGNIATGTWARPATPQMEKVGNEWVSKGWNELEHKGWVFKVHYFANSMKTNHRLVLELAKHDQQTVF
jgi:hypothetical protein